MPEDVARWLIVATSTYLALGLAFALAFVTRGAARIDPNADGATWGFRLLILPGAAALWPVLLSRWLRAGSDAQERSPHRDAARTGGGP